MEEKIDTPCRPTQNKGTVLMVDDNPSNLQVLQSILEGQGCRLLTARNGASAMSVAATEKPDLILLDIMMPEMDGFGICRNLKADPTTFEIPVIFLAAPERTEDKVRGLEMGAVDYITKPFQPEEVITRVNTHLTLRYLQRQLTIAHAELKELSENMDKKVEERSQQLLRSRDSIIFAMAKMTEARDDDTGKHLDRICRYVEILAMELAKTDASISDSWIRTVVKTAALHDIGKVGIPDGILLKKGQLTAEERKIMETHPAIGGDTLLELREEMGGGGPFLSRAIEITLGHHEKWDGSGYPFGIKGEAIALSARLVAVADVYDALVSHRIYKPGMSHEEAGRLIQEGAGTYFDPRVVNAFQARQDDFRRIAVSMCDDKAHQDACGLNIVMDTTGVL
jgi:putative two-component system response regulator